MEIASVRLAAASGQKSEQNAGSCNGGPARSHDDHTSVGDNVWATVGQGSGVVLWGKSTTDSLVVHVRTSRSLANISQCHVVQGMRCETMSLDIPVLKAAGEPVNAVVLHERSRLCPLL